MQRLLMTFLALLIFYSCSKGGDERLAEQENIRSQEQIRAQNENQREWARSMEKDLNERKYFIKALEGSFRGELDMENADFAVKAQFTSSIPIEFSDRVRTLDEINYELANLAININIKLENPRVANSAVSCIVENYKPDLNKGSIYIISEACKNVFKLMLSDDMQMTNITNEEARARVLSRSIRNNEIDQVEILSGVFESSISTKEYQFKLKRD